MKSNCKEAVKSTFTHMNTRFSQLEKMVSEFNAFYGIPREYGRAASISMVELNTLTKINENPGITVTELAESYKKTKSAVSQIVSKLETKDYVYKENDFRNAKRYFLYASKEGRRLSQLHREHMEQVFTEMHKHLLTTFTAEEINNFFYVMDACRSMLESFNDAARDKGHSSGTLPVSAVTA